MVYSVDEFKTSYDHMLKQASNINKKLSQYEGCHIVCRKRDSHVYFSERYRHDDGDLKEIGITKDKDRVYALTHAEYLRQQLDILENNMKVIEICLNKYQDPSPAEIEKRLAVKCPNLPVAKILFSKKDTWNKDPYVKNPFYKEHLQFVTTNGLVVRSKSEKEIANNLEAFNIMFRYDALIQCAYANYYADFLIKRPNDSLLIWEHFGREDDEEYMRKNSIRIRHYINEGYRPWKDLIWTLDSDIKDGRVIKHIIKRFILSDLDK